MSNEKIKKHLIAFGRQTAGVKWIKKAFFCNSENANISVFYYSNGDFKVEIVGVENEKEYFAELEKARNFRMWTNPFGDPVEKENIPKFFKKRENYNFYISENVE